MGEAEEVFDCSHGPTIGISTGHVNGLLTVFPAGRARSNYRDMLEDVVRRVESRLKKVGLSASAASKAAGLSADAIRNMRRADDNKTGRKGVSTNTIAALAPVLKTTPGWLLDGAGSEETPEAFSRILGIVGASADGDVIMTTAHENYEFAPIPPGAGASATALRVKGHSMGQFAEDGGLIYFEDQRTPPTEGMLNHIVVVETEDGRVLVKRLTRGSRPGVYDLQSIVGPTLHDIRLAWAAEIVAVIPAARARRIIRSSSEAA